MPEFKRGVDMAAVAVYRDLNNAGEAFDPEGWEWSWELARKATSTDDVDVFTDGHDLILVGTDGAGTRWAVRVVDACPRDLTDWPDPHRWGWVSDSIAP